MLAASTAVDLARAQFATTSLYHFLFVPLTLGLGPIVAIFQTLWRRTGEESWLRLTHFFGTLFLINFAIGVATGLVQEFQFGMNWSVYSKFVGNVFGAPLAIEGLAAFFLESTFLGLWIFGWNRLSPRVHLATLWIAVAGTWLSAYFILVANSFMQDPVGYKIENGQAVLTSVSALLSSRWAHLRLRPHDPRGPDLRRCGRVRGLLLALRPRPKRGAVPAGGEGGADRAGAGVVFQPVVRQPLRDPRHRAAADEDLGRRGPVGGLPEVRVLAVPGRRLQRERPDAELLDRDPGAALVPLDGLARRQGDRADRAEQAVRARSSGEATTCRRSRRSTGACAAWPTPARSSRSCRWSARSCSGSGGWSASGGSSGSGW